MLHLFRSILLPSVSNGAQVETACDLCLGKVENHWVFEGSITGGPTFVGLSGPPFSRGPAGVFGDCWLGRLDQEGI